MTTENTATIYTINNGIGSRNRRHMNLIIAPGEGIVAFTGQSISPACKVLSEDFNQNGKWSATTWKVEVYAPYRLVTISQDWGMGTYLVAKDWPSAVAELKKSLADDVPDEAIVRFIRATLPKAALQLDQAEQDWQSGINGIHDLLIAQEELMQVNNEKAKVLQEAEVRDRTLATQREMAETKEAVTKAREMLAKGASLADLKALLG